MRAHLRLFTESFRANLASAMEYRLNFLVQVFGMMLNNAAFIVFWKVLLDRTGALGGYQFRDIMFLWALTSLSFGMAHVVFGNVRELAGLIKQGDLDVYLLQPKDVLLNALCSRSIVSAWGDILYGLGLFAWLGPSATDWAALAFFGLCATVVIAGIFVIGESLTFWVGGSEGIGGTIAELLISFSLYPDKLFPEGMRWLFYSLIPSGFVVFVPLAFWRVPDPGLAALALGAAVLYGGGAWLVFRAGLKRYESGNRMGART